MSFIRSNLRGLKSSELKLGTLRKNHIKRASSKFHLRILDSRILRTWEISKIQNSQNWISRGGGHRENRCVARSMWFETN